MVDRDRDQMAWMHKNVHQLFPTVNVYRRGPVSTLRKQPRTPFSFRLKLKRVHFDLDTFISNEASATLGMIILHRGEIVFESYPRMRPYENLYIGQ